MKSKSLKITIAILIILIIALGIGITFFGANNAKLKSIKSEKELEARYSSEYGSTSDIFKYILTMPFSLIYSNTYGGGIIEYSTQSSIIGGTGINITPDATSSNIGSSISLNSSKKDYSTTNIQVENVDEADIIKTDGDYIYSISEDKIIITNVQDPENLKIESKITDTKGVPEDMIIKGDILTVILSEYTNSTYNTIVNIYDIKQKQDPKLLKTYTMYEKYYTSRCIDNKLYVISSGNLRKENNKIITYYEEDKNQKNIEFNDIKYLTDINTNKQTLISFVDLDKPKQDIELNSYLIDISNAYVSENYIYLLNQKYSNTVPPISSLFGLEGAVGPFLGDNNSKNGYYTYIYKFSILDNGKIEYKTKTKAKGKTINQYSLDEYEGNLRIALYDSTEGSRIVVFDENMNEIGASEYVAKGEKMYSSRFIGDKAYFVTYKTIDPLFVIDLSDPTKPKKLGELKIPGYSTYLHPYDENYLIGIGMQTEEVINRNSSGKVISTTSKITGMKMALFDVSDLENPKEISNVVIGDKYTTSAILTNPKALLFSKEKGIIAIPVNRYKDEFTVNSSNSYSTLINNYTNKSSSYISEGYFVCSINTEEGFKVKGTITHDNSTTSNKYPSYIYTTKLLRGLYIEDNLYTVSENEIKVNNLETLKEITNLKIEEGVN